MKCKKGRLHYIITGFMIITLLLVLLCIRQISVAEKKIEEKDMLEMQEELCRDQSSILRNASDYLTEQNRLFVFTESEKYLQAYLKEVKTDQNRDKAISKLAEAGVPEQEMDLIHDVKNDSDRLLQQEMWTMRMIEEAKGVSPEEMPVELSQISLTEEEANMSSEEKRETARRSTFSYEYLDGKNAIYRNLNDFQSQIKASKNLKVDLLIASTKRLLNWIQLCNLLLCLLVMGLIFIFYYYVIRPFIRYSVELRKLDCQTGQVLEPSGFMEMQLFAQTFNNIYSGLLHEQKKLKKINAIDGLTGIANRSAMDDYVAKLMADSEQNIGLLMMDIDNFKSFNDGFGHLTGDRVLVEAGACFGKIANEVGGIAGRLGGEEFIVIVPDAKIDQVERIAADILDAIIAIDTRELGIPEEGVRITVSIGSTIWTGKRKSDITALIRQADTALYQAKGRGKNQHVMFSEEDALFIRMENEKTRRVEVETDMYRALEREEFIPFFQPKYDMYTGKVYGAEALVRWVHRDKGFLYPDYFVPILEKDGFITRIDFAMFEKICACIQEWKKSGLPLVPIACNFSRLNFGKKTIVAELIRITEKYEVPPSMIEVELTESGLLSKDTSEKMEEELEELHRVGFTIAIDDFGVGYSSLGMLHDLPIDVLKIDKSFVQRDLKLRANELLMKGILYIADVMSLDTVVEGVETEEQVEILKQMGYRSAQGFYFSRPVNKDDFEIIMKKQGEAIDEEGR